MIALSLAMGLIGANCATSPRAARWNVSEGWHDLAMPIVSVHEHDSDPISVVVKGTLDGQEVGLRLLIRRDMRPGIREDRFDTTAVFARGIVVRTMGAPTERLVKLLADAYSTEMPEGPLRKEIPWTTIALEGDPRQIQSEPVRFKVFHDENDERGQYYELFVHVDLVEGEIALNEKDEGHRPAVIRGFFERFGHAHDQPVNADES